MITLASFKNKRGLVSVFIAMIIVSMLSAVLIFVESSKQKAIGTSVLSLEQLWGESILGEYDLNLQEKYGLFGFYGTYNTTTAKLDKMAEYTFSGKRYINYGGASCDVYDYALTGKEIFKVQMIEAAKYDLPILHGENDNQGEVQPDRSIENRRILNSLPSAEYDFGFSVSDFTDGFKALKSMENIWEAGKSKRYTLKYVEKYFKNATEDKNLGETFFSKEMEYIICGKNSDVKNEREVRNIIIAVREIMNMQHLNTDPEKSALLTAAAEALTPGPAALVTKQSLAAAWALAESINDYKLLTNGRTVQFIKTKESWAIDIDSVLNNTADKYIDTGCETGNEYKDYLRCFLLLMSEDKMIVRTMDLIQINMKYLYYGDFLLREYNAGCDMKLYVNGKDYEFTSKY